MFVVWCDMNRCKWHSPWDDSRCDLPVPPKFENGVCSKLETEDMRISAGRDAVSIGEQMKINVKLTDGAPLPKHAKPGDAGLDLTTRETVTLGPGETRIVGTGVSVEIPEGHVGLVFPRSGLGSRGVNLSNCVGVIDSGYRGEIKAPLHNNHPTVLHAMGRIMASHDTMTIERGERVCQLIVVPFVTCECVEVDELSDTERGTDGFGSTDG